MLFRNKMSLSLRELRSGQGITHGFHGDLWFVQRLLGHDAIQSCRCRARVPLALTLEAIARETC